MNLADANRFANPNTLVHFCKENICVCTDLLKGVAELDQNMSPQYCIHRRDIAPWIEQGTLPLG